MLLGAAEIINSLGSWITSMALYSILIFREHGGMGFSSGIFLASLGPALFLSPLAGWLCDRYDRRTLMLISRLAQGAATAGLIFTEKGPVVYILLVIAAICGLVMGPARTTALPEVVAPEELSQANAFMQQVTGTIKILAPALAGGLLTVVNPHTAIWLDVVSFVLSAAVLLLLPPLPARGATPAKKASKVRGLAAFGEGVASLPDGLLLLIPLNVLMAVVLMAFDVAMAVYIRDVLQTGIAFQGVTGLMIGAGTIAGSSIFLFLKGQRNLWHDVMGGFLLIIALPGALALGDLSGPQAGRIIVAIGCLLGGFGLGFVNVQAGTLFLRTCPQAILGRVSGVFDAISTAGRLVGMILTPLLVPTVVSFKGYFGAASFLLLMALVYTAVVLGRLERAGGAAHETHEVAVNAG
jgi:MFS family permease